MSTLILDHIRNTKVKIENLPVNYQAMSYLAEGMRMIASNTLSQEIEMKNSRYSFLLSSSRNSELSNLFNWFAINAVSYIRLTSLLDLVNRNKWKLSQIRENSEMIKSSAKDYLNEVIPEVLTWRNKVAAHPAISDPYPDDNFATLEFSIMPSICFLNNRFYAGAMKWHSNATESELPQWSVTEIFEDKLVPRFWPNTTLHKTRER